MRSTRKAVALWVVCGACTGAGDDPTDTDTDTDTTATDDTEPMDTDPMDTDDTDLPPDSDGDGVPDAEDLCLDEDDDLDSDENGTADCLENLLDNGQLRSGASVWQAETGATLVASTADADADPLSGSVEVTNNAVDPSPTLVGVWQCVPLSASTSYVARASYHLASGQGGIGAGAQVVVVPFTSSDCTTGELSPRATSILQIEDGWQSMSVTLDSGIDAASAKVFLRVRKSGNDPAITATFDNALMRLD